MRYRRQPTDDADLITDEPPGGEPPVIMLIGALQFRDVIEAFAHTETLQGKLVLTPGAYVLGPGDTLGAHFYVSTGIRSGSDRDKERVQDLTRRKILMADIVGVVSLDYYIDAATQSLIIYAEAQGKEVRYINERSPDIS